MAPSGTETLIHHLTLGRRPSRVQAYASPSGCRGSARQIVGCQNANVTRTQVATSAPAAVRVSQWFLTRMGERRIGSSMNR